MANATCSLCVIAVALLLAADLCDAYTLVAIATERCRHKRDTRPQNQKGRADMKSLKVDSIIKYRFANTVISSKLANRANVSREVSFTTILPETAFISGFAISINGKVYKAYVREKEEARREYNEAVSRGRTAGHVELSARDSNTFTVSVNVEARGKVTFNLTYEELLKRELGMYKQKINLNPGQLVKDLSVTVRIEDTANITRLEVPSLQTNNEIFAVDNYVENPLVTITRPTGSSAVIQWSPSLVQQSELNAEGVKGLLEVRYDVDRLTNPNQILINDGYFVHFFAPSGILPLRKHVVFVLDCSGSMYGRKIEQLQEAMSTILDELHEGDIFSLVPFASDIRVWDSVGGLVDADNHGEPLNRNVVVSATTEHKNQAKDIINSLSATGGTHIYEALHKALEVVQLGNNAQVNNIDQIQQNQTFEPMIFFLTDGEANGPHSDNNEIINDTTNNNDNPSAVIYSLAFGTGADFNFLKKLSLKNSGFARKIYEASDASLQLRDFYRKVSSPLLANVSFHYTDNQVNVSSLTKTSFPTHLNGSEIAVAGQIIDINEVSGNVSGRSLNGDFVITNLPSVVVIDYYPRPPTIQNASSAGFMERLWAYLTIQQLLDLKEEGENETVKEMAKELALQYSFVTPLTSLVVVKPDENETDADPEVLQPQSPHLLDRRPLIAASGAQYSNRRIVQSYMPSPRMAQTTRVGTMSASVIHVPDRLITRRVDTSFMNSPIDCSTATPTYLPLANYTWFPHFSNATHLMLLINGTQETFMLGFNETDMPFDSCTSQLTSTGHCRHLHHCALEAFSSSINVFMQNFCRIGSFIGVCCPDKPAGCP